MIPLTYILIFSGLLFSLGLYGVMTKRNAVRILMSIELMVNAAIINLVAFNMYGPINSTTQSTLNIASSTPVLGGQVVAFLAILLAAAEAAVGLSILLVLYKNWQKIDVSTMDSLQG